MKEVVHFTLNGQSVQMDTEPGRSLLWVLRGDLNLTGTKYSNPTGFTMIWRNLLMLIIAPFFD